MQSGWPDPPLRPGIDIIVACDKNIIYYIRQYWLMLRNNKYKQSNYFYDDVHVTLFLSLVQ